MIRHGEDFVHFTKLKGNQMAELRTVLDKRPKAKFSLTLSPEGQEAMQQTVEERKMEESARRGKRGSKGNVLFSNTVTIRSDTLADKFPNRWGFSEGNSLSTTPRGSGHRRGSQALERRSSLSYHSLALDQVEMANKLSPRDSKVREDRKGSSDLAKEKCRNWLDQKQS